MKGVRFEWDFSEIRAALRQLPADLRREGGRIVESNAKAAAVQVRTNYLAHSRTDALVNGVSAEPAESGPLGVAWVVLSKARHSHLFEYGTSTRQNYTKNDANRGSMPAAPPGHAFVPVVLRVRREMYNRDFRALLERQGLIVEGYGD
jgi:hypothetical protein